MRSSLSNFRSTGKTRIRSARYEIFMRREGPEHRNHGSAWRVCISTQSSVRRDVMKKTLAVLATAGVVGAAAIAAPAPAEAHRIGPGLAFGLAAGALTAGAIAASQPYYGYDYGPGYYGPRAYYAPGPYAYYGDPYYRHHYYYRHW